MVIFRYSVDSSAGCCHHDEIVLRLLYNFLLLLFFNLKTLKTGEQIPSWLPKREHRVDASSCVEGESDC